MAHEPRHEIPADMLDHIVAYRQFMKNLDFPSRDDELKNMVGELSLKIDNLSAKLDLIFGKSVLINGRFVSIK